MVVAVGSPNSQLNQVPCRILGITHFRAAVAASACPPACWNGTPVWWLKDGGCCSACPRPAGKLPHFGCCVGNTGAPFDDAINGGCGGLTGCWMFDGGGWWKHFAATVKRPSVGRCSTSVSWPPCGERSPNGRSAIGLFGAGSMVLLLFAWVSFR
uniref:(northern house mosquito) hypothetical protein n=1 Tax=Culex pipiens TaxID=7175 RepID=A0A8D8H1F0_CULPI